MTETGGLPPIKDGPYRVRFRCGVESQPYRRDQLRWGQSNWAFDVVAAETVRDGAPFETAFPATWVAK